MATTASEAATFEEGPLTEPQDGALTRGGAARIATIDMMRGLVIAIMVLDHVRDYFHVEAFLFDPTDATRTYPALFATRWITHLCAPTFVLLSGVSIYLQKANGRTGSALTRFLVSRGLWLVFLEMTVISFAWNFGPPALNLQVIWAIGWSMVLMAALAHLSARIVLIIGTAFALFFPMLLVALMGMPGPDNPPSMMMQFLFTSGVYPPLYTLIFYPILPWTAIMAIGFGLGPVYAMEPTRRRKYLVGIGAALVALFLVLRGFNGYGNPEPWRQLETPTRTVMDFLNVWKYPPVPDFAAVTLGLSMLVFVALERLRGWAADVLLAFGRTPLFTYICHLYIVHGLMLATAIAIGRPEAGIGFIRAAFGPPPAEPFGFSLWVVYLVWILVLAMLIPLSKWMAGLKRRRRDWWLSYI